MHELNTLIITALAALASLILPVTYFYRQARAHNRDTMQAVLKGMVVALILFTLFILYYEETREKKQSTDGEQTDWCKDNPEDCRVRPPLFIR